VERQFFYLGVRVADFLPDLDKDSGVSLHVPDCGLSLVQFWEHVKCYSLQLPAAEQLEKIDQLAETTQLVEGVN
jgi:hypothetical protein